MNAEAAPASPPRRTGPVVFAYSGQGAQYYQMGRQLYDSDPVYRASLERLQRHFGPIGGRSLTDILFSRPLTQSDGFDRLSETHPILLAISIALTDSLRARGIEPDAVLGYSLGETIAAVVSGALGEEEACWAVRAQAAMFQRHARPGRLVAVLAPPNILDTVPAWRGDTADAPVHVAAVNAPGHFVAGMAEEGLVPFRTWLGEREFTHMVLPVRFPFHTPLIEPVRERFLEISEQLSWREPRCRFLSCAAAGSVTTLTPDHFWSVTRNVVRFDETVDHLAREPGATLIDVGPSGTLAGFVRLAAGAAPPDGKPTAGRLRALAAMNQFGRDEKTMNDVVTQIGETIQ